jgi:hypothetical protein
VKRHRRRRKKKKKQKKKKRRKKRTRRKEEEEKRRRIKNKKKCKKIGCVRRIVNDLCLNVSPAQRNVLHSIKTKFVFYLTL